MAEEGFLRRWARRKSEVLEGRAPLPEPVPDIGSPEVPAPVALAADAAPVPAMAPAAEPAPERPLPTMDDVATLDKDSDFSAFVARGVDQAVRRSALKKLFADPHFNVMDKLDVYIDDYTKPSPMSEAMLASLEHAKSVFAKMIEDEPEQEPKAEPQSQQPPEQETQ
jgi:hypothetical protein